MTCIDFIYNQNEDDLLNQYWEISACKVKQKYSSMMDKSKISDISAFETINNLVEWKHNWRAEDDVDGTKQSETSYEWRSSKIKTKL